MNILSGASDLLQLVTSVAAAIDVTTSYVDEAAGSYTGGGGVVNIPDARTATLVGAPGVNTRRAVRGITIRNTHASTSCDVTVQRVSELGSPSIVATIVKVTLLAGESLMCDASGYWVHKDVNGGDYPATGQFATQAEMEAATATGKVVSPAMLGFHPGVAKFWVLFTGNSTTVLASYNVTSITDGTSEATVTIGTDFSSANWACHATAVGAASTAAGARLATARALAAGTVIVFCVDGAATTALQDPTSWSVSGWGDQ